MNAVVMNPCGKRNLPCTGWAVMPTPLRGTDPFQVKKSRLGL